MEVRDANLQITTPLPNGAATVVSASIDTGKSTTAGKQLAEFEFALTAPALTTGQLPDGQTITYDILGSANADLSSPIVLSAGAIVQTGAAGAGAATAVRRHRLSTVAPRYTGHRIVKTGAADASAAKALFEVVV